MREISIYRADGVGVLPLTIRVEEPMPAISYDDPDYPAKAAARFTEEGTALAREIWQACPGGTVDALIAALLNRRASMFRVRFPMQENHRD